MSRTRRQEWRTAIHEAGHAVAAVELRRRFRYVTIEPEEDSLGHIMYIEFFGRNFRPDIEVTTRVRDRLERMAMTSLAGLAAESVILGRRYVSLATDDISGAGELLSYLAGDPKERDAYLHWLYCRVVNLLHHHWYQSAVKALAAELVTHRTIKYRAAREIIYNAVNEALEPTPRRQPS